MPAGTAARSRSSSASASANRSDAACSASEQRRGRRREQVPLVVERLGGHVRSEKALPGHLAVHVRPLLLFHLLPEAQRTHVRPDLHEVLEALGLGSRLPDLTPAGREFTIGEPDRRAHATRASPSEQSPRRPAFLLSAMTPAPCVEPDSMFLVTSVDFGLTRGCMAERLPTQRAWTTHLRATR